MRPTEAQLGRQRFKSLVCLSHVEQREGHHPIRQHTSAYVSIRQHTPAYASIRQHTSAYLEQRQGHHPRPRTQRSVRGELLHQRLNMRLLQQLSWRERASERARERERERVCEREKAGASKVRRAVAAAVSSCIVCENTQRPTRAGGDARRPIEEELQKISPSALSRPPTHFHPSSEEPRDTASSSCSV